MARDPDDVGSDERVRRQVGRTLANVGLVLLSIALLAAWGWFGFYQLEPGQAAVILRFGKYVRTVAEPGLRWHLPPPIEDHEIVNEASIQTSDANIVLLSFVVQYRIKDAFQSRYRIAKPGAVLRDAAQAAIRSVVGRNTIDNVLYEKSGVVLAETQEALQQTLDLYESGLQVLSID